ncbi:MAG TPA: hypothetical protein DCQ31_07280 [Bacteroidales bacterium]|nr:hypothetical protein [Bacteroidales bacterium]
MFKRIIAVFVGVLLTVQVGFSQTGAENELLEYEIYYGVISLGKAEISTQSLTIKNRKVIHAVARFATIGEARRLFEIDDIYESYFDAETFLPLKFIANIKEEKYKFSNEVLFFHKSNKAKTTNFGEVGIQKGTRDIVSAFLYARKMKMNTLKPNDVVDISGFLKKNTVDTKLRYKGLKSIKIGGKNYECMQFSPMVYSPKLVNPEKDVVIYFSNDVQRIPLRIEVKLPAGSFRADLKKR